MREIHISRKNLRDARVVDVTPPALADGAARFKLDLFSLTSNNVTYAAMGEGELGYWDFFPAPEGFGRVPVWGFATVVESNAPGVTVGQRFYGYYPMGEILDVQPMGVSAGGFTDGAAHRQAKAPFYNRYQNVVGDPIYDAAYEPEQTLFRPLYMTGWWAADFVTRGTPAPRSAILSSASSKTALATAHQLRRLGGIDTIGLTSARNLAYVKDTGLYTRTVPYEEVGALKVEAPAVFIDFLGRRALTAEVHHTLGAALVRSVIIGITDWGALGDAASAAPLPGPQPEFFFVPTYAMERLKEEGPAFGGALARDIRAFYADSRDYVTAHRLKGTDQLLKAWARLTAGETLPREGLVLSF
ncbi:MAG: DUF2855 family protein [Alphaproteobacteria bacterium]|nr:DUF2855 family protein [Alphaproteobacteria bacterium]